MSIIVCNCQHCDEQQFQTLSCVHYTIFSVLTLDLFIRALLVDRILALEKTTRTPRVHLVILIPACCKLKQFIFLGLPQDSSLHSHGEVALLKGC